MTPETDPLLTYQGVAKVAEVELGTAYMWRKRGLMPPPAPETVSRRPVWRKSVIEAWLQATGRDKQAVERKNARESQATS